MTWFSDADLASALFDSDDDEFSRFEWGKAD